MNACRSLSVFLLSILTSGASDEDQLHREIAALVVPRIDRVDSVGIVVGIVRDDQSYSFGFGRPSLEDDQPPDGRTIFEIGSITKVFTAIALADMANEGLVGLDDPVAKLLPDGVRVPERDGRQITLRMLSNHSSSLPRVTAKEIANILKGKIPYADESPADVYAFLKTQALPRAPGAKFSYSNLGAGLLGHALSLRDGKKYEEMILARICRPLGMIDTRINLDALQKLRLARPYKKGGEPTAPWEFDTMAGAGAIRSSADDMLRFARANLGLSQVPVKIGNALQLALVPRTPGPVESIKIGLAWLVIDKQTTPHEPVTIFHNGGTGGFRSYLALVPERKVAVVVLSNSDGEVDSLGADVLRLVLEKSFHAPASK